MVCRKKVYPTWGNADRDARGMRRYKRERVTVYRCRTCRGFHVGHTA